MSIKPDTKDAAFSKTTTSRPKFLEEMTKEEFDEAMRIGLEQAINGESMPVDEAFDKILERLDKGSNNTV